MRAYRVAYDGRGYRGFQRQPDVPTVEDALLDALRGLNVLDPGADIPSSYAAAGRTDAGVSALAQTVAFEAPEWLTPQAFDAELPEDIWAWASAAAPEDFHATHDAAARTYEYHLHAPDADPARAREVLNRLRGEHDFHNLTPDGSGTVRNLAADLAADDPFFVLRFRSGGFPRQFVRRAAELVRRVSVGEESLELVDRVLSQERIDGPEGIGPASPEPLVLVDVAYPDLSFRPDLEAAENARRAFRGRRVTARTAARVAGRIESGVANDRDS